MMSALQPVERRATPRLARAPALAPGTALIETTVVRDMAGLRPHWADLRSLADDALDRNVFYEPDMLAAGLDAFGSDRVRLVLIYASGTPQPSGSRLLVACVPLELVHRFRRLPVRALRSWLHPHAFLGTPLVRSGWGEAAMRGLFEWLAAPSAPAGLLELRHIATDGDVCRLLERELRMRRLKTWIADRHVRALLTHRSATAAGLRAAIGPKRHKEARRLERRLADLGRVDYDQLDRAEDVDRWVDEFLALEARGWKGREQTALACHPEQRDFFRAVVHAAFAGDRLTALALRLNGRPVAMKCNFTSRDVAFAFKIAYDEALARYSPGVLLELENIRRFDRRADLRWMDSCADPKHPMIDRLWRERRTIQTMVVGVGGRRSTSVVACLPVLRAVTAPARRWLAIDSPEVTRP
jgi:CelD/BcsL family acetyltransferase involved in cellulose biosynthesis